MDQFGFDFRDPRFTFGENAMTGGIGLIPALVGAFGFAEILKTADSGGFDLIVVSRNMAAVIREANAPVMVTAE